MVGEGGKNEMQIYSKLVMADLGKKMAKNSIPNM